MTTKPATPALRRLDDSVDAFREQYDESSQLLLAIRVGIGILALIILLFVLDALFAFGPWARIGLMVGALAVLIGMFRFTRRNRKSKRMEYRLAHLVGKEDRETGNHLVNALDFREQLNKVAGHDGVDGSGGKGLTRDLMKQEIEDAADLTSEFEQISGGEVFKPPHLKQERNVFFAVLAVFLLLPVFFFPLYRAEIPRFLNPFGDNPPFSLTSVNLEPRDATVEYGSAVELRAMWDGRDPRKMEIVIQDPGGEDLEVVPMMRISNGFVHVVQELTGDIRWSTRFTGGRSRYTSASVIRIPEIAYLRTRYVPPAYTGMPPATRSVANKTLRTWKGSTVQLLVTANQPLAAGALTALNRNVEGAVLVDDPKTMSFEFPAEREGTFMVKVRGTLGDFWSETVSGTIELMPDDKPEVVITTPQSQSFATPDAQVPISVEASDDFGVRKLELVRNVNGSPDYVKVLYESEDASAFVNQVERLDLGDLGVEPGDTIDFYARVIDNHPGEPRTAATKPHQVEIISKEQHRDYLRSIKTANDLQAEYDGIEEAVNEVVDEQRAIEEETRELMEEMADLEESGEAPTEEQQQQLQELADRQQELADHAEELAEALRNKAEEESVFRVEEDYKEALEEMAEQLENASENMEESAEAMQEACEACEGGGSGDGGAGESDQSDLAGPSDPTDPSGEAGQGAGGAESGEGKTGGQEPGEREGNGEGVGESEGGRPGGGQESGEGEGEKGESNGEGEGVGQEPGKGKGEGEGQGAGTDEREEPSQAERLQQLKEQLKQAQEAQREAMEKLGDAQEEAGDIGEQTDQLAAAEDLMAGVENFKQLYLEQETLRRQSRPMQDNPNPSDEDKARMRDLASQEQRLSERLSDVMDDIRDSAEEMKPHSEKLAQQARDLADALKHRDVPNDMEAAGEAFDQAKAKQGHGKATEAAEDMRSLLREAQQGGMGNPQEMAEELNLNVPGQQMLDQLARNLRQGRGRGQGPGQGQGEGQGRGGAGQGQGGSGAAGGQPFSVFGNTPDVDLPRRQGLTRSQNKADNQSKPLPSVPGTTVGETRAATERDIEVELPPGETMMEDYRGLILEYFRSQSTEQ